jgi:hypothetical protein
VACLRQDGGEQLIQRVSTNSGSARAGCLWASEGATKNNTIQYVHDRMGNIIAEATAAGATAREYIWLPEAEIAPTFQSRAQVDRPVAVVDGVTVGGSPPARHGHPADVVRGRAGCRVGIRRPH